MVSAAIACLCVITEKVTKDPKQVLNLVAKFYGFLEEKRDSAEQPAVHVQAMRSLFVLSHILQNCDIDAYCIERKLDLLELGEVKPLACLEASYAIVVPPSLPSLLLLSSFSLPSPQKRNLRWSTLQNPNSKSKPCRALFASFHATRLS